MTATTLWIYGTHLVKKLVRLITPSIEAEHGTVFSQ